MVGESQIAKARKFRQLHEQDGTFLMPNAWDAGSACILSGGGFEAIATTSAGIAFSLGKPDYENRLSRDENMHAISQIAGATALPVSADTEACYGPELDEIATTIRHTIAAGAVGGSLEDYSGDRHVGLYDPQRMADMVRAARQAADDCGLPFTLTARAECFLVGHPDPLKEAIKRLNLYREAGADCLYAPGPTDREAIASLVREVDGPLNVVAGLSASSLSVAELTELGVKRISNGGVLARAGFATLKRAADEMRSKGTFSFAANAIPDSEMNQYFR